MISDLRRNVAIDELKEEYVCCLSVTKLPSFALAAPSYFLSNAVTENHFCYASSPQHHHQLTLFSESAQRTALVATSVLQLALYPNAL